MLFYKQHQTQTIQNNNIMYQKDLKEKINIVNERLAEQRAILLRNSYQLFPLYGHPTPYIMIFQKSLPPINKGGFTLW